MSMIPPISPVNVQPIQLPELARTDTQNSTPGAFQSLLDGMIGRVERSQADSQQAIENFVTGGTEELHSVALATQRAELEFDMFLQVRNKVVQAYQEIMRMQV